MAALDDGSLGDSRTKEQLATGVLEMSVIVTDGMVACESHWFVIFIKHQAYAMSNSSLNTGGRVETKPDLAPTL